MRKRLLLITLFFLAIDIIAVQAPIGVFGNALWWYVGFIGSTLTVAAVMYSIFQASRKGRSPQSGTAGILFIVLFPKLIMTLVLLLEDVWRFTALLINGVLKLAGSDALLYLGRYEAWSIFAMTAGVVMTGLFIYGTLFNVYRYRIHNVQVKLMRLPKAFAGTRIVQISDIHSGSLQDHEAVASAVEKINALDADIIFFTGDLVNNIADEAESFVQILSRLRAKHGVFSVLGNHDYGDYYAWPNAETKQANLDKLKRLHGEMGWRLLLNEHVHIEKDGERITVAGVENWSARGRFASYGKLDHALHGLADAATILLLSHDPSHWEAEVLKHPAHVDVTFSGHTHGMQFGFEWWKIKWSPVKYLYKQWAGLYAHRQQYLYVNRGFGVIGYPGRVGILPEITLFTLQAATSTVQTER